VLALLEQVSPLPGATIVASVGLIWVARLRLARDRKLGRPLVLIRDSAGVKPVLLASVCALAIVSYWNSQARMEAFVALYGALMLAWLSPGFRDRACGETGVIYGWYGRAYEDLEEWRLTGEHLRFKMNGEWAAVEVERDVRTKLRQVLEAKAPETESSYRA